MMLFSDRQFGLYPVKTDGMRPVNGWLFPMIDD